MNKKLNRLERKRKKLDALTQLKELTSNTTGKLKKQPVVVDDTIVKHKRVTDKQLLEGEAYEILKAQLKKRKKILSSFPNLRLQSLGYEATIHRHNKLLARSPLFFSDLQHLILYALIGDRAPYKPNKWCILDKWSRLSNVVCLIIDGIGLDDFLKNRDQMVDFENCLQHKLDFLSPASYGGKVAEELAVLPISGQYLKTKLIGTTFHNVDSAIKANEMFKCEQSSFSFHNMDRLIGGDDEENNRLRLLLNSSQMVNENYPMPFSPTSPDGQRYASYVFLHEEFTSVSNTSPMFSIDCEMCMTSERRMELTRICVVNERLQVLYHTLVKPALPITNYLTRFSGITAELLQNVTTTLSDVQNALKKIIPTDGILVGHSLNSDLNALQMMHSYVIDTSVIYNLSGIRRQKSKLSLLTRIFLGREIQKDSVNGHNPIEDAQAAMELVLLKLKKGYTYGDVILGGEIPYCHENKRPQLPSLATSIFKRTKSNNKTVHVVVANAEVEREYKEATHEVGNDGDSTESNYTLSLTGSKKTALETACSSATINHLTVCHLRMRKCSEKALKRATRWVKRFWTHTSQNGLFINVWSGTHKQNALVGLSLNKPSSNEVMSLGSFEAKN